jgi:hypothetical protein
MDFAGLPQPLFPILSRGTFESIETTRYRCFVLDRRDRQRYFPLCGALLQSAESAAAPGEKGKAKERAHPRLIHDSGIFP